VFRFTPRLPLNHAALRNVPKLSVVGSNPIARFFDLAVNS
jgi:hypothetical protein